VYSLNTGIIKDLGVSFDKSSQLSSIYQINAKKVELA